MVSNVTSVIEYFNLKIQGITKYQHLIKSIRVFLDETKSYGESYFRIYFKCDFKWEVWERLSAEDLFQTDKFFKDEYVSFLLNEGGYKFHKNYLKELKEFYDLYIILTTYLIKSLDSLSEKFSIQIENPDNFPELNYVARFWSDIDFTADAYKKLYNIDLRRDSKQFLSLHKLAQDSKKVVKTLLVKCWLTDKVISYYYRGNLADIRNFLIRNEVPIKIKGYRTIDKVFIEGYTFKNIISILPDSEKPISEACIQYLINKNTGIQEELKDKTKEFLQNYPIQMGDIIFIPDKKVVKIASIKVKSDTIIFYYLVMNANLDFSERGGKFIDADELVLKILSSQQYLDYKERFGWKSRQQVINRFIKSEKALKSLPKLKSS